MWGSSEHREAGRLTVARLIPVIQAMYAVGMLGGALMLAYLRLSPFWLGHQLELGLWHCCWFPTSASGLEPREESPAGEGDSQ